MDGCGGMTCLLADLSVSIFFVFVLLFCSQLAAQHHLLSAAMHNVVRAGACTHMLAPACRLWSAASLLFRFEIFLTLLLSSFAFLLVRPCRLMRTAASDDEDALLLPRDLSHVQSGP